jgi:hypothetical protein
LNVDDGLTAFGVSQRFLDPLEYVSWVGVLNNEASKRAKSVKFSEVCGQILLNGPAQVALSRFLDQIDESSAKKMVNWIGRVASRLFLADWFQTVRALLLSIVWVSVHDQPSSGLSCQEPSSPDKAKGQTRMP